MKTVIMAGGHGTRILSIANNIPKPMIEIENKPVLEYIIESLKEQGFNDLIITVSYQKNIIMDYFKDGKEFGVNIEYFVEEKPLGNAGALYIIKDKLTDNFLLLNADSIMGVDFNRVVKYHEEKKALATIFTHPTTHPKDCGLIFADENNMVTKWLTKEDERPKYYKNRVNAGIHIINKKLLEIRPETEKVDLDKQILKPLANTGKLFAYDSPEYIRDMGTPERYEMVCKDINKGLIDIRKIKNKQKAIFINSNEIIDENYKLIKGVDQAIKKINDSGYLVICIIEETKDEIEIENVVDTLLSDKGAYIDKIYFKNEVLINNDDILFKASLDFNIDLSLSYMVGSRKSLFNNSNKDIKLICIYNENNDYNATYKDLLDAISIIINE